MKKIYIFMAALATVAFASCQKEKPFDEGTLGKNELVFLLQGGASTRGAETVSIEQKGVTLPVETENGTAFFLEETITDLNSYSPATKGTPAYTGNVGILYHNLSLVAKNGNTETPANFYAMDNAAQEGAGWRYRGEFDENAWPESGALDFYLWMPADTASLGFKNFQLGKTNADLNFTFNYTSPETAAAQKDIIFAARQITKAERDENRVNGVPVLFHHALTGVKFATANHMSGLAEGTRTYITKISLSGVKSEGSCTVTPRKETNGYVDNQTGDYSSGDGTFTSGTVAWTYTKNSEGKEKTGTFYQGFDESNYAENIYEGSELLTPTITPSFFAEDKVAGFTGNKTTDWNINDQDGSLTFWFIPQELADTVSLNIEFYIDAGGKHSETIKASIPNFGELTKNAKWKAGQLRTYVLKATEVAVTVEDEMSADGKTKTMIQVRNMGNVPEWVRATIVGYWADAEGNAVYGYTSNELEADGKTYKSDAFFEPWNLSYEIAKSGYSFEGSYGTFSGIDSNWELGSDGYYYYKNIIGVDQAATTNLFSTYAINTTNIPQIYPLDRNTLKRSTDPIDVHLEMKIVVQAILAKAEQKKDDDGHYTYTASETYKQAWADARIVEQVEGN